MRNTLIFVWVIFSLNILTAQNSSVLVVAGGHSFDTTAFFQMMDKIPDIGYDFMLQPEANRYLASCDTIPYGLLVFYDMWEPLNNEETDAYLKLTKSGKPMLFLHHALVSYQQWPEFEKIIGGKYVQDMKNGQSKPSELSTYKHDVWINVKICDPQHPVTSGMDNFRIFDEVYGNYRVGEQVTPILKTDHPESTEIIGWENRYNRSTIIYLQPGHDKKTYEDDNYLRLLKQSVKYLLNK